MAGTRARCAASLVGVNRNTSAYYFHRLREIIAYYLEQEADMVFGGEIEMDESYFGGKREGLHEDHSRCLISDAIPHHGAESRA